MFQRVELIGHIGQIKTSATPSGVPVTQFSVATKSSYKDKQSGDWVEKTEWHRCVSFNKCAEHVRDKLAVGDLLRLDGELNTRKFQDKQTGADRFITDLVVSGFPKKLPKYFNQNGTASAAPNFQQAPAAPASGFDDFQDDDIPF